MISKTSIQQEYLSFLEIVERYPITKQVFYNAYAIRALLNKIQGDLFEQVFMFTKTDNQLVSKQNPARRLVRNPGNDRVFPIDTIDLQQFRLKHDVDIGNAIIHTGPYADELTRSFNVLALAIGNDIYFRDKGYNPKTEEGRKTIAHELMHIVQHEDGRLSENISMKELEDEAVLAESKEGYVEDPIIVINVNGNRYRFHKSRMKYYAHKLAKKVSGWVNEQQYTLEEEEYARLLHSYENWRKKVI